MQRIAKPKNARSKRALQKREPKLEENVKQAIFARTSTCSGSVKTAMSELLSLKKPNGVAFNKASSNKDIHPFEDASTLEFWSQKNDAAFVLLGSHSKKRPNNLTIARMFNHQLLDMLEIGVDKAISMVDVKTAKPTVGQKPLFHFSGDLFESHPLYIQFKSMIVDLLHGEVTDNINLTGLEHVISVSTGHAHQEDTKALRGPEEAPAPQSLFTPQASTSAIPGSTASSALPPVHFRTYRIGMLKSDNRTPYVKLELCGPSFDFTLRRHSAPAPDMWKAATRSATSKTAKRKVEDLDEDGQDRQEKKKPKNKNVDVDEMGDKVGRIHVGKQDLSKLQARKMKGLKGARSAEQADDAAAQAAMDIALEAAEDLDSE